MKKIGLYYDGDCPFCAEYSKYVDLRKRFDVDIVNARDSKEKISDFREKGFDINDGMIVEFEDYIYQGADAIKFIDDCISKDGMADKLLGVFINLPGFKMFIYPIVLMIRKVVLKVMGKDSNINY